AADRARILVSMLCVVTFVACGRSDPTADSGTGTVALKVLSNSAALISGGDALVEVVMPDGAKAEGISAKLGDVDLGNVFALRPNGRVMGLVTGMQLGPNELTVSTPSGSAK